MQATNAIIPAAKAGRGKNGSAKKSGRQKKKIDFAKVLNGEKKTFANDKSQKKSKLEENFAAAFSAAQKSPVARTALERAKRERVKASDAKISRRSKDSKAKATVSKVFRETKIRGENRESREIGARLDAKTKAALEKIEKAGKISKLFAATKAFGGDLNELKISRLIVFASRRKAAEAGTKKELAASSKKKTEKTKTAKSVSFDFFGKEEIESEKKRVERDSKKVNISRKREKSQIGEGKSLKPRENAKTSKNAIPIFNAEKNSLAARKDAALEKFSDAPSSYDATAYAVDKLVGAIKKASSKAVADGANSLYSAKIALKPESLGALFVKIELIDNKINLKMIADSEAAAKIIEAGLPKLKNDLALENLALENASVERRREGAGNLVDYGASERGGGDARRFFGEYGDDLKTIRNLSLYGGAQ